MAREILFKAKRIDDGRWESGCYVKETKWCHIADNYVKVEKHYICVNMVSSESSYIAKAEVVPETICQYTGLTDKNGNKIWENDIIGYWDCYSTENGLAEADCIGKVLWDDETLSFQVTERLSAESYEVMDECSVIGNTFDNPELLKGE